MASRQDYHDTKFNWNKGKQQQSYKIHQEWLDYSKNMPSPKTSKLDELQQYEQYFPRWLRQGFTMTCYYSILKMEVQEIYL